MINLTIDNISIQAQEGDTILSAVREAGIYIPTLCQDDNFPPHGSCGLCIVEASSKLLRACATPVAQGMTIFTASSRVIAARRGLLELTLSAHTGDCKAPCQLACPAQTDCQGYIALVREGRFNEAYRLMLEAHPFPGSIARVCPRPCEAKCRRGVHDEPINIAGIKRIAVEIALSNMHKESGSNPAPYIPKLEPSTGRSIAIVGGGPAGLTAAYFLRRAGHDVSVYERMPKMGGLLRYGIPEYRLPKAVLDAELNLLTQIGIRFHNEITLGDTHHSPVKTVSLSSLQEQYDAVIIAIGASISRPMNIPGEDLPGVIGGIGFLRDVALRTIVKMSGHIVIIGGSNTAIDTARTALRLGASSVTVAYRRTREEMPAEPEEILEAEEEGVEFKFLLAPTEITANNSQANGIRMQKMTLGEPDASGRRSPRPIPGQEEWLKADTIIAAIGQAVAHDGLEILDKSWSAIAADPATFQTNQPGVFAIGDATGQSAYAIEAIGHGRKVAAYVHSAPCNTLPQILLKDEKSPSDFTHIPKAKREIPYKKEAPKGFEETHQSLTASQAASEASRCLSCGCGDYSKCKLIPMVNQYNAKPAKYNKNPKHPINTDNPLFIYDPNKCILCGLCIKACAQNKSVLTMANRGLKTIVVPHPQDNCVQCGNCMAICPVGARASR